MVKKRSQERRMQEMVELGSKNARLYPKVRNWCKNLRVDMTSYGLLAEVHDLPIGSMKIHCDHASAGSWESMHLDRVAASFVIDNCRGCDFHTPLNVDGIGYEIIREWEKEREEREREAERAREAKAQLRKEVSEDIERALLREEVTSRSVLELVALLDDDDRAAEAARKLVRAAEIAAELFKPLALEVLCSHFLDPHIGKDCIATLRNVGRQTGGLPRAARAAAIRCLEEGRHSDDACSLIGDHVEFLDFAPESELVDAIVNVQAGLVFPPRGGRLYPGVTHALTQIGRRRPDLLRIVLKNRLEKNDALARVGAAVAIRSLVREFPDLAVSMIDPLIASLELDDDADFGSADGSACQALATIYARHPEATQDKMDLARRRASEEARAIMYEVYRHITTLGGRFAEYGDGEEHLYEVAAARAVPVLLNTMGSEASTEEKDAAARSFEPVVRRRPRLLVSHIDLLFGTLARLVQEEIELHDAQPEGLLAGLEGMTRRAQHGAVIRKVMGAIEAVTDLEPGAVLDRLRDVIPSLDSGQEYTARLKGELTSLYGRLGARHELTPEVVPELFVLLTDFESVAVRGAAVEALSEILAARPGEVPRSMLELLYVYLNDSFVYVHKRATRAVRQVRSMSPVEAVVTTGRLLGLDQAYEREDDPYFRQEILQALIHVAESNRRLLTSIVAPVLIKHAQQHDQYAAEHALEVFRRLLPDLPAEYAAVFAREVISFAGRTQPERDNDETLSGRYGLLMALCDLPREAVQANLDGLRATIRARAPEDAWDALLMIQVLSSLEMHGEASRLAGEVARLQPKTRLYQATIRESLLVAGLEAAEEFVARGDPDAALRMLEEVAVLEAERERESTDGPGNAADAFAVAHRIAERLKVL
jgi:hypothetical protein